MARGGKRLTQNKPSYGNKPLVSIKQDKEIKRKKISFSFCYFKQIPCFEIGNCSKEWHVGLIERLGTLGTMTPEEILEDNRGSKALRCHFIDWDAKNIPIKKEDIDWLPNDILNNGEDFPIMQISISIGTGRIIGFFERDSSVFQIVMLDPNHNIQPAGKTNYQIQSTFMGVSQYDKLLGKLEKITSIVSSCSRKCELHNHIDYMNTLHNNIFYFGLDDSYCDEFLKLSEKYSISEIIENGILALSDKN